MFSRRENTPYQTNVIIHDMYSIRNVVHISHTHRDIHMRYVAFDCNALQWNQIRCSFWFCSFIHIQNKQPWETSKGLWVTLQSISNNEGVCIRVLADSQLYIRKLWGPRYSYADVHPTYCKCLIGDRISIEITVPWFFWAQNWSGKFLGNPHQNPSKANPHPNELGPGPGLPWLPSWTSGCWDVSRRNPEGWALYGYWGKSGESEVLKFLNLKPSNFLGPILRQTHLGSFGFIWTMRGKTAVPSVGIWYSFGSTRPAQAAAEKGDPRHRVSRSMSPTLMILMSIVERVWT
jgi:hypothetical protein